jgi:hypothetical protein
MSYEGQNADAEVIETSYAMTERRELSIRSLTIHDLWHVAMRVKESGDEKGGEWILDVWALAHEMQNKLIAIAEVQNVEMDKT